MASCQLDGMYEHSNSVMGDIIRIQSKYRDDKNIPQKSYVYSKDNKIPVSK